MSYEDEGGEDVSWRWRESMREYTLFDEGLDEALVELMVGYLLS